MELTVRSLIRQLLNSIIQAIVIGILSFSMVHAQEIQLTPEQQQMLNSLPASQRQQAMSAIRDMQSKGTTSGPVSINEPVDIDNALAEEEEADLESGRGAQGGCAKSTRHKIFAARDIEHRTMSMPLRLTRCCKIWLETICLFLMTVACCPCPVST